MAGRSTDLAGFSELVVRARTSQPGASVKITLVSKDAVAYSASLPLGPDVQEVRLPLSAFRPAAALLVPRPYPGFGPLEYQPANQPSLKLTDAEVLQVTWEAAPAPSSPLSVDIESVSLR
jgi:hypothetical protein